MTRKRPESFAFALDTLRAELRAGTYRAGQRLTAGEIAAQLNLSPTPVREALCRLAGEGLLDDRRGQGFFALQLTARDLEHLLRLQFELLLIACNHALPPPPSAVDRLQNGLAETPLQGRTQLGSERLFRFLAATAGHALTRHLRRLQDQLAPARQLEAQVLDGLEAELAQLFDSARAQSADELRLALESFHMRRIAAAEALVEFARTPQIIEPI